MSIGDSGGGIEAALAADVVLDLLNGSAALVELLGVSVVPAGEAELGRRAVVMGRSGVE